MSSVVRAPIVEIDSSYYGITTGPKNRSIWAVRPPGSETLAVVGDVKVMVMLPSLPASPGAL